MIIGGRFDSCPFFNSTYNQSIVRFRLFAFSFVSNSNWPNLIKSSWSIFNNNFFFFGRAVLFVCAPLSLMYYLMKVFKSFSVECKRVRIIIRVLDAHISITLIR